MERQRQCNGNVRQVPRDAALGRANINRRWEGVESPARYAIEREGLIIDPRAGGRADTPAPL